MSRPAGGRSRREYRRPTIRCWIVGRPVAQESSIAPAPDNHFIPCPDRRVMGPG